jgi:hypothetical protein
MDPQQFEYVSNKIQAMHRSIKNVMEITFSVSPLLALSTRGWAWRSLNSLYLLRVGLIQLGSIVMFIDE